MNDSGSTTVGTHYDLANYCPNRLPCGYCARLMLPCPVQGYRVEPTWYQVTCGECAEEPK